MKRLPPGVQLTPAGTYVARYRDADGRQHSRTFPSAKIAAAWKADREADVRRGDHIDPHAGRIRLDSWWAQWDAARGVEASTASADRARWRKHLKPRFGALPLASITRIKVQAWVRDLEQQMAPASVHKCVRLLSAMLRDAAREGHVRVNPCADLDLPVVPPGRERSFTADEIDRILAAMTRPRDRLIVLALVDTGMRWEELVGLRLAYRRDGSIVGLDLMRRRIVVADVTVEVGKLVDKAYPKGKQRRTVPVTDRLHDAWVAYLGSRQNPGHEDRGESGEPGTLQPDSAGRVWQQTKRDSPRSLTHIVTPGPGDRAVVGERGGPLRKTWRDRRWAPALEAAGVEYAPPHTLRHTYGSRLVDGGMPLNRVQKLLGHASITTSARYLHVDVDDWDGVLTALDAPRLGEAR